MWVGFFFLRRQLCAVVGNVLAAVDNGAQRMGGFQGLCRMGSNRSKNFSSRGIRVLMKWNMGGHPIMTIM